MRPTTSIRLGFVKSRREVSGCHFWQVSSMIATIVKRRPSFWGVISPIFGASRVSSKLYRMSFVIMKALQLAVSRYLASMEHRHIEIFLPCRAGPVS